MKLVNVVARILVVPLILTITTGTVTHYTLANAQTPSDCYNGLVMPDSSDVRGPAVILIHGYYSDSGIWSKWEPWLQHDGIPYCTVTFMSDDSCGTAKAHANELSQIIQKVKVYARDNHLPIDNLVNIVGHSKGGLDARKYLDESGTHDVPNLVMIGTPNGGDIMADYAAGFFSLPDYSNFFCRPALDDLTTHAKAIQAGQNVHTKYYTIHGAWNPNSDCPQLPNSQGINWPLLEQTGWFNLKKMLLLPGPNDGIVPASSVESLPQYTNHTNLGKNSIHDCHTNLLSRPEYDLTKRILLSGPA